MFDFYLKFIIFDITDPAGFSDLHTEHNIFIYHQFHFIPLSQAHAQKTQHAHTHRQTQRYTNTQIRTNTKTHKTKIYIDTDTQKHRNTDKQTNRQENFKNYKDINLLKSLQQNCKMIPCQPIS